MTKKLSWILALSLPLALMGCGKEATTEADSMESQLQQAQKENPSGDGSQAGKRGAVSAEDAAATAPAGGKKEATPGTAATD
jgi:hypothetical protein